jgi:transcription antitermination factor NusG
MTDTAFTTQTGQRWYALHVRNRYEKAVSTLLQYKGFAEFLPVYRSRRRWSQHIAEIELPLFPGYVFCSFDPAERRVPIMTTPGVMAIVGFGGKPVPIEPGEIEAIHRVLATGIATEPWKYVPSGQRVRVERGSLAGLEGVFIETRKDHRLLLSVTLLQRSVAVQIDESCVVPIRVPTRSACGSPPSAVILAAG